MSAARHGNGPAGVRAACRAGLSCRRRRCRAAGSAVPIVDRAAADRPRSTSWRAHRERALEHAGPADAELGGRQARGPASARRRPRGRLQLGADRSDLHALPGLARRRDHQSRIGHARRPVQPRPGLAGAEPGQAQHHARSQARSRARPGARADRPQRRRGRELLDGSDGPARAGLCEPAAHQSAHHHGLVVRPRAAAGRTASKSRTGR